MKFFFMVLVWLTPLETFSVGSLTGLTPYTAASCSYQGQPLPKKTSVRQWRIVISPEAARQQKIAARELVHYFGKLYPNDRFEVVNEKPSAFDFYRQVCYLLDCGDEDLD